MVSACGPLLAGHAEIHCSHTETGEVVGGKTAICLVVETQSKLVVTGGERVVGMDTEQREVTGRLVRR